MLPGLPAAGMQAAGSLEARCAPRMEIHRHDRRSMPEHPPAPEPPAGDTSDQDSLLRMAAMLSRLGAWSLDMATMRLLWSRELREIHEVADSFEPTLENGLGFYAPEHRPIIAQAVADCIAAGKPFDIELRILTAAGNERWARAVGEAIRDPAGRIVRIQGAFQDISRGKALAEQNQALAQQLAATLATMSDCFFTLDRQWRFTYLNAQAKILLERRREELLGANVWEAFPAAVGSSFERAYRRAFETGTPARFEEFYEPLGKWFQVRAYPSRDALAVYFLDVTEAADGRAAMQRTNEDLEARVESRTAELRALASSLEAFSYSIAHDLRGPVTSIAGLSQVLWETEEKGLSERGKRYLRRIKQSATRMEEMIAGLLALAKLSRAPISRGRCDLSAEARRILAGLAAAEPQRRVSIKVHDCMEAEGDLVLLRQVLENLLTNAWKFSARTEDAFIEFGCRRDEQGQPVYFVRDNGAGFDMAEAGRLFEVFQRQHTEREFPGTGVGLAIVKRIIARHGGEISARAEPGRGATFFFTLGNHAPAPAAPGPGAEE